MSYSSEILADSPLAYYRLDEASGTTLGDTSGNGRTGTYNSGTLGQASLLISDYANTSVLNPVATVANAAWMNTNSITVKCRVKFTTLPPSANGYALVARYGTGAFNWLLWLNPSNQLAWQCRNAVGTAYNVANSATVTSGTTYEVAATYDGSTTKLFVDGTQVGSTAVTNVMQQNARTITLGRYSDAAVTDMAGYLDEVAVYGSALSSGRLLAHYSAGLVDNKKSAVFYSFMNAGLNTFTLSKDGTMMSYLNAGLEVAGTTTVIRQPQGWGVLPTGPQSITYLTESAKAVFYAYQKTDP